LLHKKEEKDERRTSSSSSSSSRPGGSADDHEKNDRDGVVPLLPSVPFVFGVVVVVVSVVVVDLFDGATTKGTAQQQQQQQRHAFSVFFHDVIVFCSREEREKVFRVRVVRDDGDVEHRRRDAHVRGFSKHHPETIQEFKKTS